MTAGAPRARALGDLGAAIVGAWGALPGRKTLKVWAPATDTAPEWTAALDPGRVLFVASAFKAYVLAAFLREVEEALDPAGPDPLAAQFAARLSEEWDLDERVFALGSRVFNPPNLTGEVLAQTAIEAMISKSDNTAADMTLAHTGPERVRRFLAAAGLRNTRIPDSTRQLVGYVFGAPDWATITWPRTLEVTNADPPLYPPRPVINDTITMASTPDDFVSFYARALQGDFFRQPFTLQTFRATLALADVIPQVMPLGVNAFMKGGSLEAPTGDNALSLAGGLYAAGRWAYFAMVVNWTTAEAGGLAEVQGAVAEAASRIFLLVQDGLRP
jgi:beta-lactamase class A